MCEVPYYEIIEFVNCWYCVCHSTQRDVILHVRVGMSAELPACPDSCERAAAVIESTAA